MSKIDFARRIATLSEYGQTRALKDRVGHDIIYLSLSGIMGVFWIQAGWG
jgi:crotonobetainyl-CoA:carnitine CoA-transferase CaiB-like acyl-CoA transferase